MKINISLIAMLLVLAVTAAQCVAVPPGSGPAADKGDDPEIMIMEPYARASIPNGAVFMTLMNEGGSEDVLISAETDVAKTVELHESKMDENGVMKMSPVPNIPVPAGGSTTLEPGGLHLMLLGLSQELAVGDKFNVTLNFEKSSSKTVEVEVRDSIMGQPLEHGAGETDSMSHGEAEMGDEE